MRLFSFRDRERIKDELIVLFSEIMDIISVVLVGSGSVGFTDEISDLDFYIVVDNNCDIQGLLLDINSKIKSKYQLLHLLQIPQRCLSVCILHNFLEIDIGLTTINNLKARRGRWLVVYDTTNKVNELMCQSWQANKQNDGKSYRANINNRYMSIADEVWHYLFHAVVGIKRRKYWRAIGEMDIARNMLIELLGYRCSLETKRFRGVDEFPVEVKGVLECTLATNLNQVDMSKKLYTLINAIYSELDEYFKSSDYIIKVGKNDVLTYFSDVLGNLIKC